MSNDIIIQDSLVSAQHLALSKNENGEVFIQDLYSTNGTFVNGHKIGNQPQKLHNNDIIKIGNTTLSWQDYFKIENIETQTSTNEETQEVLSYEKIFWFILLCFFIILLILSIIWYNQNVIKPKL